MDGEEEGGAALDPASAVERASGTTELDALNFEVELLTIAALRSIADDIAERVASRAKALAATSIILITEDDLTAAIAFWRYAETGLEALEKGTSALLAQLQPPGASKSKKAAGSLESAGSLEGAGIIVDGIQSLAEILSWLRVDTVYSGRVPEVEGALRPALAGQLLVRELDVLGTETYLDPAMPGRQNGLLDRVGRLLAGKTRLEAMQRPAAVGDEDTPPPQDDETARQQARIVAALAQIDAWLAATFAGGEGHPPLVRLLAASEVTLLASRPGVLILDARVIKTGGRYRTRKHLFSTLFGFDSVSYSGGAAVAFTLLDAATGKAVLSDVVHHSSGDVRFSTPAQGVVSPSNLQAIVGRAAPRPTSPPASERRATDPHNNAAAQEATVTNPPTAETITPNSGDDEAAEGNVDRSVPTPGPFEAVAPWRVAKSLLTLREQINALAPRRSTASDGAIGDEKHRTRNSDHNPWVDDGRGGGVVTAIDVTHDAAGGCDADAVAESIRAARDARIKYVIWNKRIAASYATDGAAAWAWRKYTGSNGHTHHIHISVKPEKASYDSTAAWNVKTKA